MDKRKGYESTYKRIEKVFEDTQKDLMSINDEGLMQQIAVMNLAFQQMAIGDPRQNPLIVNVRGRTVNATQLQANNIAIEVTMRSNQIRQLTSAQQAVLRRRVEANQDFETLKQEYGVWQQKWPELFDLYWKHTDPEGTRTLQENEEALAALKLRSPSNVPAMISQGLLETRLGHRDDAKKTLSEAIRLETSLNPVALAARALAIGDKQKSRPDLTNAIKTAPKNPFVIWLKAKLAASYGDFATARKELNGLLSVQNHEIPARRFIAVLIAVRPGKGSKDPADALQHAKLASDLSGEASWYTELVLAMALHLSGETGEARILAEHAKALSKEESAELCSKVIEWMESNEPLDWRFVD